MKESMHGNEESKANKPTAKQEVKKESKQKGSSTVITRNTKAEKIVNLNVGKPPVDSLVEDVIAEEEVYHVAMQQGNTGESLPFQINHTTKNIHDVYTVNSFTTVNVNVHRALSQEEIEKLSQQCKALLQERYVAFQTIEGIFGLPFIVEGQYINLQMIYTAQARKEKNETNHEKSGDEKSQENNKLIRDERISSFEDLFGEKRTVKIEDLFKSAKEFFKADEIPTKESLDTPHFILIQGRAGIGKTTFTKFIAREWAKPEQGLWPEYQWVFRLVFRDLQDEQFQREEQYSLAEWIYATHFAADGVVQKHQFSAIWSQAIKPALEKKQVLFILDGFDETPVNHACEQALEELFEGTYQAIPKIVTTRPYGLEELPKQRRNVEIVGFTHDNVERYVLQYFRNASPQQAKECLQLLKQQPLVWSNAHVPISLNIMCGIYAKATAEMPAADIFNQLQTMTALYEQMVNKLLERAYLEQYIPKQGNNTKVLKRKYLDSTSDVKQAMVWQVYEKAMRFLELLAYRGMQQETASIVLSAKLVAEVRMELKVDAILFGQIRELGFIKPVLADNQTDVQSYEFLHLTFQEYFAASYIAYALGSADFSHKLLIQEMLLRQKYKPRYQIIWWFVSGLLRTDAKIFNEYLTLLQDPFTKDLIGHYELGLLVRVMEEGYTPQTVHLLAPVRLRIQQALKQLWKLRQQGYFSIRKETLLPFVTMLRLSPRLLAASNEQDVAALLSLTADLNFVEFLGDISLVSPKLITF